MANRTNWLRLLGIALILLAIASAIAEATDDLERLRAFPKYTGVVVLLFIGIWVMWRSMRQPVRQ